MDAHGLPEPAMTTSELSRRLGFMVTVAFLEKFGIVPMVVLHGGRAMYWRAADFPAICKAIACHLDNLAAEVITTAAPQPDNQVAP